MRYQLTTCARDNTTTLFRAGASTTIEVEYLITIMRRSNPQLVITIHDTLTGMVETRR